MKFEWKLKANKKVHGKAFHSGTIKLPKEWENFPLKKVFRNIQILLNNQFKNST